MRVGKIVTKNGGSWEIDEGTVESYKNGTGYYASEQPITYDAYQTEAYGPYYTHGASYYELYGQQ